MEVFTAVFFGHRYIDNPIRIKELLYTQICNLLDKNEYVEFLVGRNGEFDLCVASAVREAGKNHRDDNSSLVLVLPYPTAEYLKNQKSFYEYYNEIIVSEKASSFHPKAAIQIRNRETIDRADTVICYIEESFGGAYNTIEYAKKQNKDIINLANF